MRKNITTILLLIFTVGLAVIAIVLAQRIYQLRNESIAPTAPKSKPKAADNPNPSASCTLTFALAEGPTLTPGPTSTPGPTGTPMPNPGCNETCDINNNKCSSDSPYCIDYEGDNKGPVCGRQQIAGQGPKCENPKPGCDELCDVNNNQCSSDSPYCVDYEGDSKGAVCGKQQIAGQGPQCNPTPTAVPTKYEMPAAGSINTTLWTILGGAAFLILGLLFL